MRSVYVSTSVCVCVCVCVRVCVSMSLGSLYSPDSQPEIVSVYSANTTIRWRMLLSAAIEYLRNTSAISPTDHSLYMKH